MNIVNQIVVGVGVALVLLALGWIGRRVRRWGDQVAQHLGTIAGLPAAVDGLTAIVSGFDGRITHLERHTGVTS